MKIVTTCGCGLGTCFVLKFTAQKAAAELGLRADIIPSDIASCALERADLYLLPYGMNASGLGSHMRVAFIRNVVSVPEVKAAIRGVIEPD